MKKVFIDTNVIVDLLVQREGFVASAKVLASSKKTDVLLYASVLTLANVAYILRKSLIGDALYVEMEKIANLLNVADLTKEHFLSALTLKSKDFEDALQYFCACSNDCEIIITRNKKDFSFSAIDVFTPEEFLSHIDS